MKSDEQILSELEQVSGGLMFVSESDSPFETVRWEGVAEVSAPYLRGLSGQSEETLVQTETVEDFFRAAASEADWKGAAELATARKYQTLIRVLEENLEDVRVYRVGEINIKVYIVGRSAAGNWLGLSTRVVET